MIENWKKIIQKLLATDEVKQEFTSELFKMYGESDAKYPLQLAYKLADAKDKPDLVVVILENSDPQSYMIAPEPLYGNLRAIHIAAAFGYVKAARNLISNSWACSAVDFQDEYGLTPIFLAAEYGHFEMVQLLLSFSGNPNIPASKHGLTPLAKAAQKGHIEVVRMLMSATDAPNAPDNDGRTPIFIAACNCQLEIVKFLVDYTDDPNAPNNIGKTPIHVAAEHGSLFSRVLNDYLEMVKLLANYTDSPIAPDNDGRSPIHFAADTCAETPHGLEMVKFLANYTVSPNAPDNFGQTPIMLTRNPKIAQFLDEFVNNTNMVREFGHLEIEDLF